MAKLSKEARGVSTMSKPIPCQCEHAAQHNDGPCGLPSTETVITDFGTYEMCSGCAVDIVSAGFGTLKPKGK